MLPRLESHAVQPPDTQTQEWLRGRQPREKRESQEGLFSTMSAHIAGWELHPLELAGFHGAHYFHHTGFDVGAPVLGEWDLRGFSLAGHLDLEGIVLSSTPFKISITSMDSEGYDTWQDNPEIAGLTHHCRTSLRRGGPPV
jgi:hypothetical protein